MRREYGRIPWMGIGLGVAGFLLTGTAAAASEGAASWRGTYDTIMLWVNFLILAFIIVKYGRRPLMTFLRNQKAEVGREIQNLEAQKERVTTQIEETFKALDESDERLKDIKDRIIRDGERKKEAIINDAQEQSRFILETSKHKIESQIVQARKTFRAELIDEAVSMAMRRLPNEIREEDNLRIIEQYVQAAQGTR